MSDFEGVKKKVLNWTKQFGTFCFLDNHQYQIQPNTVECILAAGAKRQLSCKAGHALDRLEDFRKENQSWLFGHLSYDLKNEIESLTSANQDRVQFPDLFFFEPQILIRLNEKEMLIEGDSPEVTYDEIMNGHVETIKKPVAIDVTGKISKTDYIDIIEKLRAHILRGDCYEINFCQEFFAENADIDPIEVYEKLSAISPNPFSALYRISDHWLICASPERFLKKQYNRLISQPIKGTSKRSNDNVASDEREKDQLRTSSKDRSENVMVVDLVRNDLARVCKEGTVHVDELYSIYSFPQVHQMISTVSGIVEDDVDFSKIMHATFPMGSMTGAPKRRVMELIEEFEQTRRGLFSGALGYISPDGNFDFNVVIRSILYNAASRYLSYQVGSGITFYSDPQHEWEECMLKAEAIKNVLVELAGSTPGSSE